MDEPAPVRRRGMTRIQNLVLHTETLRSLEALKKSLSGLADLARQQGLQKESDAFAADVAHIEAKIQNLRSASESDQRGA
jgi:hypothetical protein